MSEAILIQINLDLQLLCSDPHVPKLAQIDNFLKLGASVPKISHPLTAQLASG